ncbi:TorD/DmsD family molecular chaperone [Aliiruegeria lutimaris]|uniref:TorA specific chaperone n=1 Tax=Aliiruegeria lutimaris TaxID=571298 RepID=A0A1G8S1D5_9RHOB|nr:molecular chaperone TorD family protein [Aliiruegeria lutimaris]SDJ23074.1 TorA specific chaperone [Aliiruegeria lutimaris]
MMRDDSNETLEADLFRDFAVFFGAPLELEDIAALRREQSLSALSFLEKDARFRDDLAQALSALLEPPTDAEAQAKLNRAYFLLFLGVAGGKGAPPFESAYRGTGRLFQEPVAEMAALLESTGLKPAEGFVEPPDHLTIELSLLEQFLRLDATITGIDAELAISNLRARLRSWVPAFARACAENDTTGFYAALARAMTTLLAEDTGDAEAAA